MKILFPFNKTNKVIKKINFLILVILTQSQIKPHTDNI